MPSSRNNRILIIVAASALLIAGAALAFHFSSGTDADARGQLLRLLPTDSTAVICLDLDEFRSSPFLARLYAWAPHPAEDSEYAQFVRDTGFSYERDLQRAAIAVSNHGATTDLLAIADGKFDRKKIETFLKRNGKSMQQGKWKIYLLNASVDDRPLSLTFLSDSRIAVSDSGNLAAALSRASSEAGHAEWNERFERLAGAPLFAVIRQDSALQQAMNTATPGLFRSPALSTLLKQLQWISIAGKPDGDVLRVISDGECQSDSTTSQLRDFLQGVLLLAQTGLNDPKLRQQMNPEEREAYLEILKNADIQKIDRGEWKSVRVALSVTPRFLDLATLPSLVAPADKAPTPEPAVKKKPAAKRNRKKIIGCLRSSQRGTACLVSGRSGLHIAPWIDRRVVHSHFVVHVRAGGTTADSAIADNLAALDAGPGNG